jgi:hypothetical protein
MTKAPRDGALIRLWLRDGSSSVGYYNDKWWGFVSYSDPVPLIRGSIAFRGWEPVTRAEVAQLSQSARRELVEAFDEDAAVVIKPRSAIVRARKLRRR